MVLRNRRRCSPIVKCRMNSHGIVQVVAAISKQLATLNTNSRYLHEGLCSYAEELTSTFPEPLSVSLSCIGF